MTWKELYSKTREEVCIKPVKTKDDLHQIMADVIQYFRLHIVPSVYNFTKSYNTQKFNFYDKTV